MTHLFIDRQPLDVTQSVHTWADLLMLLDRDMDAHGRVLTEVQFDGVDEPTFRAAAALNRPLSNVLRIDAATATPNDLLRDCLLEAAGTVAALADESTAVADQFRTSRPDSAHPRLGQLAAGLSQLVVLVQTLHGPLGLDLGRLDDPSALADTDLTRFGGFVDALVTSQAGGDYQTVADVLDYDLVPFLRAWQTRFERLAG